MTRAHYDPDYTPTDPERHEVLPSGRRADVRTIEDKEDMIVMFVKDYWEGKGYAPSLREIARALGLLSLSTTRTYVVRMIQDGRLEDTGAPTRYVRPPE